MTRIEYFKMNIDLSQQIAELDSDNVFILTAQKVAVYSIIPFMMILAFESSIKYVFTNLANLVISVINLFASEDVNPGD